MKKISLFLAMFIFAALLKAQAQWDKQPFFTNLLAGESINSLESKTTGGNISVSATSQSESRVEVFVTPNNGKANSLSKEEIQKRLDEEYELSVTVVNNKVVAIAKPKDRNMNWKKALNISFAVFITKNVSSDLTTSGGNIKLSGISGTQDFTTSGGNLDVDNLSGKITGRTSGGNIHLSGSKDEIELTTSGGNIHAENSDGKMKLVTSGGSLKLKNLKGKSFIAPEIPGGDYKIIFKHCFTLNRDKIFAAATGFCLQLSFFTLFCQRKIDPAASCINFYRRSSAV